MTDLTPLQKELAGALVGLARALDNAEISPDAAKTLQDGLRALQDADDGVLTSSVQSVRMAKHRIVPDCAVCKNPCGRTADLDINDLDRLDPSLKKTKYDLLSAAATYAASKPCGPEYAELLARVLFAVGYECITEEEIEKTINSLI